MKPPFLTLYWGQEMDMAGAGLEAALNRFAILFEDRAPRGAYGNI
jgi:hypothetical protein